MRHGRSGSDCRCAMRVRSSEALQFLLRLLADGGEYRGWSTTVLTSNGELYTAGTIENAFQNASVENLERLKVSSQHPRGADRLAAMTVSQFSSGRSHILALSDAGDVWFWWLKMSLGWKLTFLHCDVPDIGQSTGNTAPVTRVVAGWDCSSAFVPGKGILVWKIPQELYRRPPVQDGAPQATLAVEDSLVPSTHYQRPKRRARHASNEDEQLGKDVGEVTGYVALEGFIVFLTDLGKVFAAKYANSETLARGILELDGFEPSDGKAMMTHIEGSFRSFAVFNTDGDVVLGDCDQLDRTWKARYEPDTMGGASTIPRPVRPAALQNRGVISLAFGDWHKLALTAEGDILSFGREPQSCGSLGLGRRIGEGFLRGVRSARQIPWLDGESMGRWRRIFFSPEQREWLRYMGRGGLDAAAGLQAMAELERNEELHLKSADWFEEKGADWDRHPNLDTLGQPEASTEPAYKVVSISAAGWHCGAIVLADDEKIRRMYEAHAGFLPIPGGSESSDIVSRAWNRFSAMWKGSSETPQSQTPPTTDHLLGRDHRYYYSDERWEVVSQKIPEEARHEVRFPVFQDVPAQQEL